MTARRRQEARPGPWAAALVAVAFALPLLLTWGGQVYDVAIYWAWSQKLAAGQIPYRDFPVEYPPLAFAGVVLPGLVASTLPAFAAAFMVGMATLAALQKGLLWQESRNPRLLLLVLCSYESLLYVTYLKRFDVLAAVVTTVALVRLVQAPASWAGWWCLGLAAAIKLYPVLLLPLCAGYAARRVGRWRAFVALPGVTAVAGASTLVAAHLCCGPAAHGWLGYHQARGLHLPSSYTAIWLLLGNFAVPLKVAFGWGAIHVDAPWATVWAERASVVTVVAVALTWAVVLATLRSPRDLWRGALATVAALLLAAKVFSPQFVAWIVPLAAMAGVGVRDRDRDREGEPDAVALQGGTDWPLLVLTLLVAALTAELFPGEIRVAGAGEFKRWILVGRTSCLLGLWGWALARPVLDRLRRRGRWHGEGTNTAQSALA